MLRSLFTGISGLRTHQTMMDVTGNNIANVNTNGFKSSQTQFQDTLSQLVQAAGAPTATQGGTNPAQIGLGVRLAGISTNFSQGATQLTGRPTDVMINGDGFFVVDQGGETMYTRAGSWSFDQDGLLVTPEGGKVLNVTGGTISLPVADPNLKAFTIGPDGVLTGVFADGTKQNLGQIAIASFPNPAGLEKAGSSLYRPSANSGTAAVGAPGSPGRGKLTTGTLEMSNVDLAQEFTNMIIAQRGFQANSRIITASDEILQDLVNLKR